MDYNQNQAVGDPTHEKALDPTALAQRSFLVITGETYFVNASSADEAEQKLAAYVSGEDCPCGLPQWGEEAAKENQDLCECVSENETQTIALDQD